MISMRFCWLSLSLGALVGCDVQVPEVVKKERSASPATSPASTTFSEPNLLRASYEDLAPTANFPEPTEQELAANALGRIGKPAVPMLMSALRHRDPRVRHHAAVVLAKIGPDAAQAAPALTAALDDEELLVRKAASRALGEIGPAAQEAIPALMRTLVQPQPVAPGRN
jgi:HEAT repeat protein